jgi:hypothetical protein
VSVTRTSTMQSVPSFQKPRKRISPRSYLLAASSLMFLVGVALAPFATRPGWMDEGFVADCRRSEGFTCQVDELISYLIVAEDNEATFFAC